MTLQNWEFFFNSCIIIIIIHITWLIWLGLIRRHAYHFFLFRLFPSSLSLGLSKTPLTRNWRRSRESRKKSSSRVMVVIRVFDEVVVVVHTYLSYQFHHSLFLSFIFHSTNKWKYSTIYIWLNLELNCKFYSMHWLDGHWQFLMYNIDLSAYKKQSWFLVLM